MSSPTNGSTVPSRRSTRSVPQTAKREIWPCRPCGQADQEPASTIIGVHEPRAIRKCAARSGEALRYAGYGMEARVGIEPTNKGFADLCLTTWLPRHDFQPSLGPTVSWSGRRDSNPRHRPWQGRTLPTELLPLANPQHSTHAAPRKPPPTSKLCPTSCGGSGLQASGARSSGSATGSQSRERLARAKACRGCAVSRRIDCGAGVAARVNASIGILEVSDDRNPRG